MREDFEKVGVAGKGRRVLENFGAATQRQAKGGRRSSEILRRLQGESASTEG
jgi:hypothetical protein